MGVASVQSSDKVRESPIKKQDKKKDIKLTKGSTSSHTVCQNGAFLSDSLAKFYLIVG